MIRTILERLLAAIPVLVGVTALTYVAINLAPGDPVLAMVDPEQAGLLGPQWIEEQKAALGLDKPLPVRYVLWLRELARGNLGYSMIDRQPVAAKVGERLWPTLKLMLTAFVIGISVSIPVGILAAVKQYSLLDYLSNVAGMAMISVPAFFAALVGIYLFGLTFKLLPTAGMVTVGASPSLGDNLHHLILPATVLGLAEAAPLIRYARSGMLEVIRQTYVVVARAKGLRERVVLFRHALRNALIPLITVIALLFPGFVGGSVIVEQVFAWPGMGTLAITAVIRRDYPVIMGINLMAAAAVLLSSLVADILYVVADPRIRYE